MVTLNAKPGHPGVSNNFSWLLRAASSHAVDLNWSLMSCKEARLYTLDQRKASLDQPSTEIQHPLATHWSVFPCPQGKKGVMAGPTYKMLPLSGGPWYKFPCREPKRRSLLAITTLHCTLDTNNTQRQSTASACYCSSADGVAAKLSLQDWEMDFLFYKQNHVQMNWGSPPDNRNKIYYLASF